MSEDFEVISTYTRAEALEDGMLLDVTLLAKEAGYKVPVAITCRLFHDIITPDEVALAYGNSVEGRMWDVLSVLKLYIRHQPGRVILFPVIFLKRKGNSDEAMSDDITLKAVYGPGDSGEPVITILKQDED